LIYIHSKQDPHYHNNLGFELTMEEMLINQLATSGYQITGNTNNFTQVQPVVIQCFEAEPLVRISDISDVPTMQLIKANVEWTDGECRCQL
jgi:glycerophosphoryl diester phosphodiesterase